MMCGVAIQVAERVLYFCECWTGVVVGVGAFGLYQPRMWWARSLVLSLAGVLAVSELSLASQRGQGPDQCRDLPLLGATLQVIQSTRPSHLYLTLQNTIDGCILRALWEQGVKVSVVSEGEWWVSLQRLTYTTTSFHLLIGHLAWITASIQRVPLILLPVINKLDAI
ncbi:hypothetical protein Pcinc_004393 [Petrolisthes cinctipes]|uniref:Uncharacterized protein n=1 Tax=Petrolisthes cinctipes TaxID=88211 RepID=A0AAE1L1J0_PETCI|nr:hypothetical protein Pcinc_004393 [Petrolisthes cinctipes]